MSKVDKERLIKVLNAGLSQIETARALGVTRQYIGKLIKKFEIEKKWSDKNV